MYSRFRANWKMSSSLMSDGAGCAKAGFAPSGAATEAPRPNRAKPFRDCRRDRLASMGPSLGFGRPKLAAPRSPEWPTGGIRRAEHKKVPAAADLAGNFSPESGVQWAWQFDQAHLQRSSLPAHRQVLAARRLLPLRVAAGPSLSWL